MKRSNFICLIVFAALALFPGCGGTGVKNQPPVITLTTPKDKVLANGIEAAKIQIDVRQADGTAVADGTVVACAVSDEAAILSAARVATNNGTASVTLTRAPVLGANFQTIDVSCLVSGVTDTTSVKFINQPASAEVFIAFDREVGNLAALSFTLDNTAGATFDNGEQFIAAINTASGSLVAGNFIATANSNVIGLVSAAGVTTGTGPIIKATYAIGAASSLPTFSIDTTPASFIAADASRGPTIPQVTAANMVVTVTFDTEQ